MKEKRGFPSAPLSHSFPLSIPFPRPSSAELAEAVEAGHLVVPADGLEVGDAPVGAHVLPAALAVCVGEQAAAEVACRVDAADPVVPRAVHVVAQRVPDLHRRALAPVVCVHAEGDVLVGPALLEGGGGGRDDGVVSGEGDVGGDEDGGVVDGGGVGGGEGGGEAAGREEEGCELHLFFFLGFVVACFLVREYGRCLFRLADVLTEGMCVSFFS